MMRWLILLLALLLATGLRSAGYTVSTANRLSVVSSAHDVATSAFTVCVRWNPDSIGPVRLPTSREAVGYRTWGIYNASDNQRLIFDGWDASTEKYRANGPSSPGLSAGHNSICGVFVPSTSTTLYENDLTHIGSIFLTIPSRPSNGTYIGYSPWGNVHANGSVEELVIWSRALSAAEVSDWQYSRGCSGNVSGMVSRYTVDGGSSGNIPTTAGLVKDLGTTGAHMTATGSPTYLPFEMLDCIR